MNHYRFDVAKYEQHIGQFRTNADRVGQLLREMASRIKDVERITQIQSEFHRLPFDADNSEGGLDA